MCSQCELKINHDKNFGYVTTFSRADGCLSSKAEENIQWKVNINQDKNFGNYVTTFSRADGCYLQKQKKTFSVNSISTKTRALVMLQHLVGLMAVIFKSSKKTIWDIPPTKWPTPNDMMENRHPIYQASSRYLEPSILIVPLIASTHPTGTSMT